MFAAFLAHVGGATVEIITPLVLLFSQNHWLTLAAVILMVVFHAFITSTFPLAVPLEWNILFAYLTIFFSVRRLLRRAREPTGCAEPMQLAVH